MILPYAANIATVIYLGSYSLPDKAEEFLDGWLSGAGLSLGSPILRLRNRLIGGKEEGSDKTNRTRNKAHEKTLRLRLIIRAWNAFVDGEELFKLVPQSHFEIRGARFVEEGSDVEEESNE